MDLPNPELYEKDLNDSYNHDGVITHLEPASMECEVKITMNKAGGGDGFLAELFQILKDDAVKSPALNIPANLENSAVATGLEFIPIPKKGNAKECSNYCTIAFIPHASKCSKFSKVSFNST